MKLSIVIPYYNRKALLLNVLKSIEYHSKWHAVEIIIVDDGSNDENKVDFDFIDYKLIRLERSSSWQGPCIAYNIGFKAVTGDIIMINSSEVVHNGNIIDYVYKNMKPDKYIAFSTYMMRETDTLDRISYDNFWGVHSTVGNFIPYCGVIAKEKMEILGGYDERFAKGIGFDDYDFTHRVKNLGIERICVDNPYALHQWHKPTDYPNTINRDLLEFLNTYFPDRIKANG